ncbi:hypothetical protein [Vibrio agarivorans]|uniref:Lysozyme inhibitor LprI N-terminal domain-containing protein n=1 Tax=Vibrio agarivorans TaxID=153622 RepID=A0ABT7Y366_9VIBR|nr:hypothetical protein [Vibrio agarivorans]MDN2482487.1 hypothetical protein [Vibrio agarivorans]
MIKKLFLVFSLLLPMSALSSADWPDNYCDVLKYLDSRLDKQYQIALGQREEESYKVAYREQQRLNSMTTSFDGWSTNQKVLTTSAHENRASFLSGLTYASKKFGDFSLLEEQFEKWNARKHYGNMTPCPR